MRIILTVGGLVVKRPMGQQSLSDYSVPTTPKSLTRTVVLPLETSQQKNERLQPFLEEYQAMCQYAASMMTSFQLYQWKPHSTQLDNLLQNEYPLEDMKNKASTRQQAGNEVGQVFHSWKSNGYKGNRPGTDGKWGETGYLSLRNDEFEIVENDRGYGLKAAIEPYQEPFWWHVSSHEYHEEILADILSGDSNMAQGSCQLRLSDDGTLAAHLTYSTDIPRYEPDGVPRIVGVDRGVNVLYAAAVVTCEDEEIVEGGVNMFTGDEFRHHRERLEKRRDEFQEAGALAQVKEMGDLRARFTNQTLHRASNQLVEFAREHAPCAIAFEDLTGYRQSADEPIHDWPYRMLEEKVRYKAHAERIPVLENGIPSHNTSTDCNRCGRAGERPYRGNYSRFYCHKCNYEVHSDVNAAINIAQRGVEAVE